MKTLDLTRARISEKIIIRLAEDYEGLEVGDMTKVTAYLADDNLLIPRFTREIKIYEVEEIEYCYKMGLLMAAGLWKNPEEMEAA